MTKWIKSTAIRIARVIGYIIRMRGIKWEVLSRGMRRTGVSWIRRRYLRRMRGLFHPVSCRSWWWPRSIPKPRFRNIRRAITPRTWWCRRRGRRREKGRESMARTNRRGIIMGRIIMDTSPTTWTLSFRTVFSTTTITIRTITAAIRTTERRDGIEERGDGIDFVFIFPLKNLVLFKPIFVHLFLI